MKFEKKKEKRISIYGSVSVRVYLNPGVETLEHVALVVKIFNGFLLSPDKAFFCNPARTFGTNIYANMYVYVRANFRIRGHFLTERSMPVS